MENVELVLIPARARKLPEQMYVVGVAIKGNENKDKPNMLFYSTSANIVWLKMLIKEHNDLVRSTVVNKK